MNICFLTVCQFDEFAGGVDRVCCLLIRELLIRSYRVITVYGSPNVQNSPAIGCEGDGQYQFPSKTDVDTNVSYFVDVIRKNKVDIVIDVSYISDYHRIAFLSKSYYYYRLVLAYHGDPLSDLKDLRDRIDYYSLHLSGLEKFLYVLFLYLKYPISYVIRYFNLRNRFLKLIDMSDSLVVLCDDYVSIIKRIVVIHKNLDKIIGIPNPISINKQTPQVHKKNQVVFVGRMVFQKRVDRLLKVWSIVEYHMPNSNLIIVGDGPELHYCRQFAFNLGLSSVRFVGSLPSSSIIAESKVVVMASSHEGFGMSLLEGMSMGTVPVAYDSYKSVRLIIDNEKNGYLIRPFSYKQLAEKILLILNDNSLFDSLREASITKGQQFDVKIIADKWETLFRKLCH